MQVKLVSYTQPVIEGITTPDNLIAYVARVSNPSNQLNTETGAGLIAYLIRNHHWSPLQMADITVEIVTTRDIGRQILRHRSFEFQEFSQRYADPTKSLELVTREARLQDTKNRQNSIDIDDVDLQASWLVRQHSMVDHAMRTYEWAISNGIAKEVARAVLPEGLTETRMYMKGSIRSWFHYCQLRMDKSTQKEHREVAAECWNIVCGVVPSIIGSITNE
jgi:thymidylate synthase (FAD)